MTGMAKFKFNYKTGEIEIEGSEDFVRERIQTVGDLIELFASGPFDASNGDPEAEAEAEGISNGSTKAAADNPPATFGEWMHSFKSDVNDLDKALITARFVQSQSTSNDFKTAEVNKALKDHGIKLSNASGSLKRLVEKKLLFQTRKVGALRFLRVSQDGQAHLASLNRAQ